MKKIILTTVFIIAGTALFAQKAKSMREVRDSIFTVMELDDQSKKAMHDLIGESGKRGKAIRENEGLSDSERKQQLKELSTEIKGREQRILTPGQQDIWKKFIREKRQKSEPARK